MADERTRVSVQRTILATSGGFDSDDRGGLDPGGLVKIALRLSGAERPKFCVVETAGGDEPRVVDLHYAALAGWSVDVSHVTLLPLRNIENVRDHLLTRDVIWVSGGSVAGLMALWRLHGLDEIMREAWEAGIVLAGRSAGSICWHVGGTTDSFGPTLRSVQPFTDGLGLLPYGNGVHMDGEPERQELVKKLVADGVLPASYGSEEYVGLHYSGTELVGRYTTHPGSGATLVEREGGTIRETRLEARLADDVLDDPGLTRPAGGPPALRKGVTPAAVTGTTAMQAVHHMREALEIVESTSDEVGARLEALPRHERAVQEAIEGVGTALAHVRDTLTALKSYVDAFDEAKTKLNLAQAELDAADPGVSAALPSSLRDASKRFRQSERNLRAVTDGLAETVDGIRESVSAARSTYAEQLGVVLTSAKAGLRYAHAIVNPLTEAIARIEED